MFVLENQVHYLSTIVSGVPISTSAQKTDRTAGKGKEAATKISSYSHATMTSVQSHWKSKVCWPIIRKDCKDHLFKSGIRCSFLMSQNHHVLGKQPFTHSSACFLLRGTRAYPQVSVTFCIF